MAPECDKKPIRFGLKDIIVLVCLLTGFILTYIAGHTNIPQGKTVVVTVSGKEYTSVPLTTGVALTINIDINGSTTNVLHVEDGTAYITDANCPDKLCEKTGKISRVNESIVCLPNKVVVTIKGDETEDKEIDAVSGK